MLLTHAQKHRYIFLSDTMPLAKARTLEAGERLAIYIDATGQYLGHVMAQDVPDGILCTYELHTSSS